MSSRLAYHIQHYKKQSIKALESHNWKKRSLNSEYSNKEIDTTLSYQNVLLTDECKSLYSSVKHNIETRVTGRMRKDSNWLTEAICYPPEDIQHDKEKVIEYFQYVLRWHEEKFQKENIQLAVIHFDETTPHMHLDMIPITCDGRLSTKELFTRESLRQIHTDLSEYLKEKGYSIIRGDDTTNKQVRSRSVKAYKAHMEEVEKTLKKDIEVLAEKYNTLAVEHNRVLLINQELKRKNLKMAKGLLNSKEYSR